MFNRESKFFELSKGVVERFLQSAVIVDDGAAFYRDTGRKPPTQLTTPGRRSGKQSMLQHNEEATADRQTIVEEGEQIGRLNAKTVIDSFARKGIVCSILLPDKEELETLTETLERLAACSDIIVLDWSLYKDQGKKALEIVERIARLSVGDPGRIRLIAIYTVNPHIVGISQEVKAVLCRIAGERTLQDGKLLVEEDNDGLTLTLGAFRITVLAKDEIEIPGQYHHQIVSFGDLANRITEEFTAMTAGLVSNVVLSSLAQVRESTHRILSQFSADLDAPYLTHRALLLNPSEAEDLLTALVAEELQAVLEEARVGNQANIDAIRAWVTAMGQDGQTFRLVLSEGSEPLSISAEQIIDLLEMGIQSEDWEIDGLSKSKKTKNTHTLPLVRMFAPQHNSPNSLNEKFAFVTTMRACYSAYVPKLTLGTLLRTESTELASYWVCIQPKCDCVRIESPRSFLFLPLRLAGEGRFNIVLNEENAFHRFQCSQKPHDLVMIRFAPNSPTGGFVAAKEEAGDYYFWDETLNKYKWMGQLRPDHAQRLSNRLAATLARVGLDESEWLRRWAGS